MLTGLIGLVFGLPSLRVKGFYLAMATLAAQFIIPWALRYPLEDLTGGTRPLNVPAPIIGPFLSYSDDAISDGEPLTFVAGDPYFVDVISVRLPAVNGAYPHNRVSQSRWRCRAARRCEYVCD